MDISGTAPVCRLAGRNLVNFISAGVVRNDTRRLHEKMRLIDADAAVKNFCDICELDPAKCGGKCWPMFFIEKQETVDGRGGLNNETA